MADQVLALYGRGKGPRIPIQNRQAKARITGKIEGSPVVYHVETPEGVESVEIHTEGDHELPAGSFVCAEHDGKSKALLCFVRM